MKPTAVIADMAGTTVRDDGVVLGAFADALDVLGVNDVAERAEALDYVVATMGQSKIEVFTALFGAERAPRANDAFEETYRSRIDRDGVEPMVGVPELFRSLDAASVPIALTTGFSTSTRQVLVDALGWQGIVRTAISPSDAGRGRPYPDMILLALARLGIDDPRSAMVVGDTASDMAAGSAAGVGWVVGVLTGTDDRERLVAAGATQVLESITQIEGLWED
jgi:phosphonatase-like hydrolase